MSWPATDTWRAPVGDFPPRWATAWGDDAHGLWADLQVGDAVQRLRWIEPTGPGGFWMGSPRDEREAMPEERFLPYARDTEHDPQPVVVAEGFWLADTPCTQAFWAAVMGGDTPSHFTQGADASQRPVEQVSWDDVQQHFLPALIQHCPPLAGLAGLPTETQWEYAARAGSRTAYPWGDTADDTRANWNGQHNGTTPVGQFAPNAFGLFDMHGNVWEWCADAWRTRLDLPEPAPQGQSGPPGRAVRGGSWIDHPGYARSAYRFGRPPGGRLHFRGFRLALRSSSPAPAR